MKNSILILFLLLLVGCTTDKQIVTPESVTIEDVPWLDSSKFFPEEQEGAELKGKPVNENKVVTLVPTAVNNNSFGRVMTGPENYTGEIPLSNNGGYTDWDLDGEVDDLVVINQSCYWPHGRAWISVLLNGTDEIIVSYNIRYGTQLIGFTDVDNDGDEDLILSGAKFYPYNHTGTYTATIYHVGYNEMGQYPLSPAEIFSSMEPESLPNGNGPISKIKWNTEDFGLSNNYSIHVYFGAVGSSITQTVSYGGWGLPGDYFERNAENFIRISNEQNGVIDSCEDVFVYFQL